MPRQNTGCMAVSAQAIMAPDEKHIESDALVADDSVGGYIRAAISHRYGESRVSRESFLLGVTAAHAARVRRSASGSPKLDGEESNLPNHRRVVGRDRRASGHVLLLRIAETSV
jgi:hypothetical protein